MKNYYCSSFLRSGKKRIDLVFFTLFIFIFLLNEAVKNLKKKLLDDVAIISFVVACLPYKKSCLEKKNTFVYNIGEEFFSVVKFMHSIHSPWASLRY
jgi:hypothetical protein